MNRKKKKAEKLEPETDLEFEDALELLKAEVNEVGENSFEVSHWANGKKSVTSLDAEDYSSALFEAWHFLKE